MRLRASLVASLLVALVAACGTDGGTEVDGPGLPSGRYLLVSANEQALPFVLAGQAASTAWVLNDGELRLQASRGSAGWRGLGWAPVEAGQQAPVAAYVDEVSAYFDPRAVRGGWTLGVATPGSAPGTRDTLEWRGDTVLVRARLSPEAGVPATAVRLRFVPIGTPDAR